MFVAALWRQEPDLTSQSAKGRSYSHSFRAYIAALKEIRGITYN